MQSSMEFPWSSAKVSGQGQEQQEGGLRVLVGDRQDAVIGMKVNCRAAVGRMVIIAIPFPFVALECLFWNNVWFWSHQCERERRQTRASPALVGYRARTCDVLEEAEGDLCVQPEEMTKAGT